MGLDLARQVAELISHCAAGLLAPDESALDQAANLARTRLGDPCFCAALHSELVKAGYAEDGARDAVKTLTGLAATIGAN